MRISEVGISTLALFVFLGLASNVNADPNMNCTKTAILGTPTIECTLTWSFLDQVVYTFGTVSADALGPNGAVIDAFGFDLVDYPSQEFPVWLVNWAPGPWDMNARGTIFFTEFDPGSPTGVNFVFHPDSPVFDDFFGPLP